MAYQIDYEVIIVGYTSTKFTKYWLDLEQLRSTVSLEKGQKTYAVTA